MKCRFCTNEARYISEFGELVCGTCPVKLRMDSIKIGDVPELLRWARKVLAGGAMGGSSFEALRSIVGREPDHHLPALRAEGAPACGVENPDETAWINCRDKLCEREADHPPPHQSRVWDPMLCIERIEEW